MESTKEETDLEMHHEYMTQAEMEAVFTLFEYIVTFYGHEMTLKVSYINYLERKIQCVHLKTIALFIVVSDSFSIIHVISWKFLKFFGFGFHGLFLNEPSVLFVFQISLKISPSFLSQPFVLGPNLSLFAEYQ
uniref:CSON001672 protein n=1 Tax=Culicoides sonorensis TaxID=179676 RepID=A0A336ML88_CULSO